MLKTSWSMRGGVVDDHDDLGLGVEVGPGRDQQLLDLVHSRRAARRALLVGSCSSSIARIVYPTPEPEAGASSVRPRSTGRGSRARELALDLGVDVERLLALAHAALVAGDDELADLLAQRLRRRRPGRPPGRAASRPPPRRRAAAAPRARGGSTSPPASGGPRPADLGSIPARPGRRTAAGISCSIAKSPLPIGLSAEPPRREGEGRDRQRDQRDQDQDRAVVDRRARGSATRVRRPQVRDLPARAGG